MADRLRILFVTEDDPLYVIRLFEVFFREFPRETNRTLRDHHRSPVPRVAEEDSLPDAAVLRSGRSDAAHRALRQGQAERDIDRAAGVDYSIPMMPARSVNAAEYVDTVRRLSPDVIVSVAAPEIFRADMLGTPRLGCINIHSGRLPVYRGMMPTFWQMMNGEQEITVTVHEMAEVLDGGRILGTIAVPVTPRDSLDRVITATKQEGARLLIDVLEQIGRGESAGVAVDMNEASYFSFPKREHVDEFRQRGHRLI